MVTSTYVKSYTVADVRRVLGSFAADFGMFVMSSGLSGDWPRPYIEKLVSDLVQFADAGYLAEIDVSLWDGGTETRAERYTPTATAYGWTNQRPGGRMWPRAESGRIAVVVTYSRDWSDENEAVKEAFKRNLQLIWTPSDADTSHANLARQQQYRRYESNGYGLERASFGG